MNNMTLTQKMRSAHVKRWQIVRVAREQNIAEHMYRTYLIAMALCDVMGISYPDRQYVAEWALMHDLPEVVTGDINTPVKRAMRKAVPDSDPIRHIELSLDSSYENLYCDLKNNKPYILTLVKLADLMEAVNFLMDEGIGSHADGVELDLREAIIILIGEMRSNDFPDAVKAFDIYNEICTKPLHQRDHTTQLTRSSV